MFLINRTILDFRSPL